VDSARPRFRADRQRKHSITARVEGLSRCRNAICDPRPALQPLRVSGKCMLSQRGIRVLRCWRRTVHLIVRGVTIRCLQIVKDSRSTTDCCSSLRMPRRPGHVYPAAGKRPWKSHPFYGQNSRLTNGVAIPCRCFSRIKQLEVLAATSPEERGICDTENDAGDRATLPCYSSPSEWSIWGK
jgi:hypothetical protein